MFSFLYNKLKEFFYDDEDIDVGIIDDANTTFNSLQLIGSDSWSSGNICDADLTEGQGTITFVNNAVGIIDQTISFPLDLVFKKTIRVGDSVSYTASKLPNGVIKIISIECIEKDDESDDNSNLSATKMVQVVSCADKDLVLSDGSTCNLGSILSSFWPIVGDWLQVEVEETDIVSISPLRSKKVEGLVTAFKNNAGSINRRIYFNIDALENGYSPAIGDMVLTEAIESDQGIFKWRALSVIAINSDYCSPSKDSRIKLITEEKEKNGIKISGDTDFGAIPMGSSKELELTIINLSSTEQVLLSGKSLRHSGELSVEGLEKEVTILPDCHIIVNFTCTPKYSGLSSESFIFFFQDFHIMRTFHRMVNESDLVTKAIQHRDKLRSHENVPVLSKTNTQLSTKPKLKKRFFAKRGFYHIPEALRNLFENAEPRLEMLKKLLSAYPWLKDDLISTRYCERFHLLLFLEEIQMRLHAMKYNKKNVFFHHKGDCLVLEVDGLTENKSGLWYGDKVIVTQPWLQQEGLSHLGIIRDIGQNSIFVEFNANFQDKYDNTSCDVEFEPSVGDYAYSHDAVERIFRQLGKPFLFPSAVPKEFATSELQSVTFINTSLNDEQRAAVMNALRCESRLLPHIIFGPPGTGKTVTVVELILQLLRLKSDSRILVCGPSNSSADLLATRIIDGGKLKPGQIARLYSYRRSIDNVPELLAPYAIEGFEAENLGMHRITVGTCTSVALLHHIGLPPGHFTHIVIDEAGCAMEPICAIPMSFLDPNGGLLILAGDPEQLGPVVLSKWADKFGLNGSFLGRIMSIAPFKRNVELSPDTHGFDSRFVTRLVVNYRSVEEILILPSRLFYNGLLKPTVQWTQGREAEIISAFSSYCSPRKNPLTILFHGIRGQEGQEPDSPSWLNPQELQECLNYICILSKLGVKADEIGVISPYIKQCTKLRQLIPLFGLEIPKIGSVEEFQGQERQVIILSCVRSSFNLAKQDLKLQLGFISNPRRVNVSLTRARSLLIMLGNPHLLVHDPYWRSILSYCLQRSAYVGCDLPKILEPTQNVNDD